MRKSNLHSIVSGFINWSQSISHAPQHESRGRGNQGDWACELPDFHELPHHAEWNRAVEAKKRARHARRLEKKGLTL